MEIDLHGYHPAEMDCRFGEAGQLADLVKKAWEEGASSVKFIHGHGFNRGKTVGFVHTNTGYFGLCVRKALRHDKSLRQWIYHTTLDCSDIGCTSINLKPNPAPTRTEDPSLRGNAASSGPQHD